MAEEIERKYEQFRQEFTVVYRKTLTLSRELASELSYLEQEAASVLVDGFIEELKEKYAVPHVAEYLEEVRHNILDNLDPFKEREGEEEPRPAARRAKGRQSRPPPDRDPFRVYGVNVLLGAQRARHLAGHLRDHADATPISSAPSSAVTIRAACGPPISWTCAPARCCAPTAAS